MYIVCWLIGSHITCLLEWSSNPLMMLSSTTRTPTQFNNVTTSWYEIPLFILLSSVFVCVNLSLCFVCMEIWNGSCDWEPLFFFFFSFDQSNFHLYYILVFEFKNKNILISQYFYIKRHSKFINKSSSCMKNTKILYLYTIYICK